MTPTLRPLAAPGARRVVIGLGASTPDAAARVDDAVRALDDPPRTRVVGASALHLTPAFGGETLRPFVNAGVVVETTLAPRALLAHLHALERRFGRVRATRNASRALDLDLLVVDDLVLALDDDVAAPHPALWSRPSAWCPLVEARRAAGERARVPVGHPSRWPLSARVVDGGRARRG